ncbi:uncharacterized protein LOC114158826 isoform X2 [Xiphophorus couchianus]|uniref:uncharacterized protein LOC114158826 isoform X2 n=1 Tax=Xiphophorus couchianus TaxID=32473 RepID=UPI001015CB20|nr:uncharacterized protein LOC114158826 isoform X2 [Xiphophorus couchianus]
MINIFRSAAEKSFSVQQLIDGQEMLVLVLVLVVVLQFEGTRGGKIHLYHREGENVVLPSERPSSDYPCSNIFWLYNRDTSKTNTEVGNGKVDQISPRASRLKMDSSCSLIINTITADDAGFYTYRSASGSFSDHFVYLSVLTISVADPTKEDFTLQCSLWRYDNLGPCPEKSFLWLDETGTELTSRRDDHWSRQKCFSSLTVKHQSDTNTRFTCQFSEGTKVKVEAQYTEVHLYHRAGDEAVLPCNRPSSSDSCSSVNWTYNKNDNMNKEQEVPRSASLDRICSLIINNITAEDAGRYRCRYNTNVYLNMMIISPLDADPTDDDFTLQCSLLRYRSGSCPVKSLLWVDETGSELTGEGDGYKSGGQTGCVSHLTVNLQSSRRFTCQFVEGNKVKIEAQYGSEAGPANIQTTIIILGSVIVVLLLLVVLAAVFIKLRKSRNKEDHKTTTENQDSAVENHQYDELQANLTYATVSHSKPSEKIKVQTDEETVTYSAVRTKTKTKADIDPSDLYSCLTEPK